MALMFDDDQAAALLDALGLPADTTDIDTALATVKDAVTASTAENAQPSAVAAAARRVGLELIDADTITALRRDANEGRQIKAAAARQKIEDTVADAISKGKITPARRKHWLNLIEADPGMAEVLASVPDETAVPLTEIGHGVGNEDTNGPTDTWFH
ncbi:Mu-like prophage I protein [Mycobacterium marinum]|uniref:Mu-like prophage I protein n=1 Tax=Mycobacterium marinum TaxID=1781 RepID=A0A3E2MQH5_MYCMR|nr:phage protease [Mycobacterium marinum]RFZ34976.1 Mu-like prophage I protein [Mycobacterium marinum]